MARTKRPAIYVTKQRVHLLGINLNVPNAGPRPNITGMRRYWGVDACIIICGQYAYHVSEADWRKATGQSDANLIP